MFKCQQIITYIYFQVTVKSEKRYLIRNWPQNLYEQVAAFHILHFAMPDTIFQRYFHGWDSFLALFQALFYGSCENCCRLLTAYFLKMWNFFVKKKELNVFIIKKLYLYKCFYQVMKVMSLNSCSSISIDTFGSKHILLQIVVTICEVLKKMLKVCSAISEVL